MAFWHPWMITSMLQRAIANVAQKRIVVVVMSLLLFFIKTVLV
jgi:hypothetical protein